jgi:Icc-related predicted phosphoesterase
VQPLICFTGHIHEARGIDAIGRTKLINPGPLREGGYAYAVLHDDVETLEIRVID